MVKVFLKLFSIHFNPIKDIEISSSIRLQMILVACGEIKNSVALRSLSAKGVINNIRFGVGDLFLKQSKYTLYNYSRIITL